MLKWIIGLLAMSAAYAPASALDAEKDRRAQIDLAYDALTNSQPQKALEIVLPLIAAFDQEQKEEKRQIYCGMTGPQTIAYMVMAAQQKRSAVAVSPDYCHALFVKGFAFVDLGKPAEARTIYEHLIKLAPMHAHFLAELGQNYRLDSDWPRMLATCKQAAAFTDLGDPATVNIEKGIAWRCMGYALIEQGKFDEAAALYRKCLELDPNDAKAKNELSYIAEQKGQKR